MKPAPAYITLIATSLRSELAGLAPRAWADGLPLWTNRYHGPGNGSDFAKAIAVDSGGNVFVTGYSAGTGTYPYYNDYATVAYSNSGVPLWANRYDGSANGPDHATAVAVNSSGNVIVTGYSSGIPNVEHVTICYSKTGAPLWTNRYAPGSGNAETLVMAVDGAGNVFVSGQSPATDAGDYVTVACSGAGVPLWTNFYGGPVNSTDVPTAIAADKGGNVIVTGYSTGTNA